MFYKDGKVVAKVQVHLCYDSMKAVECIRTMKKKVRKDEYGILVMAAEFMKIEGGPYERGMFLFLMTYDYLRQNTSETIWEDMLKTVDLLRDHLKYHELYITGFIDKYITLGMMLELTIRDIQKNLANIQQRMTTKEDLEDIKAKMATKEDLERFATKEDLARFATKEDLEKFGKKLIDNIARLLKKKHKRH